MFKQNSNLKVERKSLNKLIKKWLTALVFITIVIFQGCDKDEDESTPPTTTIETAFITEWGIASDGDSITIPINSFINANYNYNVDWGDESTSVETTAANHKYEKAGIYTVKITGDFPAIFFNNSGDKDKIKKITNWGTTRWESFLNAFHSCSNLELTATDSPDLSGVTNLEGIFVEAIKFNTNINHWNVSNVTNMSFMFSGAESFNQPLDEWDTSSVTNMRHMFARASAFTNQDLSGWNVDNVRFEFTIGFDAGWGVGNTPPDFH